MGGGDAFVGVQLVVAKAREMHGLAFDAIIDLNRSSAPTPSSSACMCVVLKPAIDERLARGGREASAASNGRKSLGVC